MKAVYRNGAVERGVRPRVDQSGNTDDPLERSEELSLVLAETAEAVVEPAPRDPIYSIPRVPGAPVVTTGPRRG